MPEAPEPGARILVVDDNEPNRDLLSRRLARQGHSTAVAAGGEEALGRLAAEPFDLVLLDIMMPGLTGYQVLERLKADEDLRHIPVIMISALDDVESVVRCVKLGAEDHLSKPFEPTLLNARISASLAKKRLRDRERLYALSMERELAIGRAIQSNFIPESLPDPAGWEIAAAFQPARQVAGDFYDAFRLEDGRVALVLGDVCGKGVGAALFMAILRTLLRILATAEHFAAADGAVDEPVAAVSDYIAEVHGRTHMFATLFFGILEPETGVLRYVNAGQEPPVVVGGAGPIRRLEPTGPAVGLMGGMEFTTRMETIGEGETVFVFSDGVVDARAPDGKGFGWDRLLDLLQRGGTAAELVARIRTEVDLHAGGTEEFDDITLLALRRSPRETAAS